MLVEQEMREPSHASDRQADTSIEDRAAEETDEDSETSEEIDERCDEETSNDRLASETDDVRLAEETNPDDIETKDSLPPSARERNEKMVSPVGQGKIRTFEKRGSPNMLAKSATCSTADSWGQVRFENLHPIARLRYRKQTSSDSEDCPHYY
jgi:hypothetical protein